MMLRVVVITALLLGVAQADYVSEAKALLSRNFPAVATAFTFEVCPFERRRRRRLVCFFKKDDKPLSQLAPTTLPCSSSMR